MVAFASAQYAQAAPVNANTKAARDDRMADKEAAREDKKAAKERKIAEAARQIPAASAKVDKLQAKRAKLLDQREDVRYRITHAKSESRRQAHALSPEDAKAIRLNTFEDRKYATPAEADALTKQSATDLEDTTQVQALKAKLQALGKELTKTEEALADAKEDERKLHVKAYKYDDLRDKQAARRAKDDVEGRSRIAASRYSNEEAVRHEKREEIRAAKGIASGAVDNNPTAKEMTKQENMDAIRARTAARNAESKKEADRKQAEKENRRAQEKADKKAKYAANKKADAKPAKKDDKKATKSASKKSDSKSDKKASKKKQDAQASKGGMFNSSNADTKSDKKQAKAERVAAKKAQQQEKADQKAADKTKKRAGRTYSNQDN